MKIHFIGIGGIGVSALAQYFLSKNYQISGSDLNSSEITQKLENQGINIIIGKHSSKNISKDINLVIYSPAVISTNLELKKAKSLGIKTQTYPQALGEITKKYYTIAVSGTHGKSTTSSMLAIILSNAGFDPTVIIGTKLKEFGDSNFRSGNSKYLVIEADEYKESFLNYHPKIIVVTNIDNDHLDYYKNLENILKSFSKYFKKMNKKGFLIANNDDENTKKVVNKNTIFYSLQEKEAKEIKKIIKIPGDHNIQNALAAFKVAQLLGIKKEKILEGISLYKGSWRRFEIFNKKNFTLISDYGHHPTEIEKTLKATREKFPTKRIRCVFQPHQIKRTLYLFDDFIKVLKEAPVDEIILSDIYNVAGREDFKKNISSKKIAETIKSSKVKYKKNVKEYVIKTTKKNEILIIMGAGDIYNLFLELKNY